MKHLHFILSVLLVALSVYIIGYVTHIEKGEWYSIKMLLSWLLFWLSVDMYGFYDKRRKNC